MFIIYNFNQPALFKDLLIRIITEKKLSNPMQSEIILIDNDIIAKWMKIELANYFNIAANFNFMSVQSFMQKISTKILLNNSINTNFSYFNIFWKFMQILPKIGKIEGCSIIQEYLYDDYHKRKCGQFAEKLTNLFMQYLIYRPDWLNHWASYKIVKNVNFNYQLWQSEIWRTLLKYIYKDNNIIDSINIINPWEYCVNFLETEKKFDYDLPSRMFIFGVTSIAPIFWKILKILGRNIDIYFGFMNLGYSNWDRDSNREILSIEQLYYNTSTLCSFNEKNYLYNNTNMLHPLLNKWGNIGQNILYFLSIQSQDILEYRDYSDIKNDSLLHILQKEILEFKKCKKFLHNNTVFQKKEKLILRTNDQSITYHVCHNIQREIEILHDNLLSMFINDPFLSPGDIMVMAPDICLYEAAICSVFNNIYGRELPFIINNYQNMCIYSIASTFLNILEILYTNKFTSEEILSLLSISSISNRFNINSEELKLLHKWIRESGIRWGLDEINIYNENDSIPITFNQNTWYFGLYRMLMGYIINNKYGAWNDISPYDGPLGGEIDIIEKLGKFLTVLKKWKERLYKSYPLKIWISYIIEIINDFFYYSDIDIGVYSEIIKLKTNCIDILMEGIKSGYFDVINVIVLKDQLFYRLNQKKIIYQFLPNVIKFNNITPMCIIPCKIICFLGMNENTFPRNNVSHDFDLIIKYPRNGDHNIYETDCYAFLSALLLAKEKIYFSFIGYNFHDYSIRFPSVVINELLEYISIRFCLKGDENLNIEENIKHIRQYLYQWHSPFSFSLENFFSGSKYQSFAKEWCVFKDIDSIKNSLYMKLRFCNSSTLPQYVNTTISFYDLYKFYSHPIKIWSQQRLGIYFHQNIKLELFNDEPFSVDSLHYFTLNMKLIDYLIQDKNLDKLFDEIRGSGILPYGPFGELFWFNQCKKMNFLSNKIKKYIISETKELDIFLTFNKIKLTGQLSNIRVNGLIRWKPMSLSMKDVFLLWLEHTIYCSLGGTGESRLFGINDTWHFSNLSMSEAREFLLLLIQGYLSGMNTPLFLLYQTGGSWINHMFNWYTKTISIDYDCQKKANQKLIQVWKGMKNKNNVFSFTKGECHDPYLKMFFPFDLGEDDIKKITETAKKYFIHPMMNRIHMNNNIINK